MSMFAKAIASGLRKRGIDVLTIVLENSPECTLAIGLHTGGALDIRGRPPLDVERF